MPSPQRSGRQPCRLRCVRTQEHIAHATLTAHAEARRRAQAATRPPTFVCFVNDAALFADEYRRYLERQLRDNVGFPGTPLRILFRGKAPRSGTGGGRPGGAAAD